MTIPLWLAITAPSLAATFGYLLCALLTAGKASDQRHASWLADRYREGKGE